MPEVCRFFGIVICMYFRDHQPPHFHAFYSEDEAVVEIESLALIRGSLSPRVLGLVVEWASLHRRELHDDWNRLQRGQSLKKIAPLE